MKRKTPRLSDLIQQAKSEDTNALEQLVERFWPLVKKRTYKMGLNYFDIEDMKAELTIEILEAVKRFEPRTDWGKKELEQWKEKYK